MVFGCWLLVFGLWSVSKGLRLEIVVWLGARGKGARQRGVLVKIKASQTLACKLVFEPRLRADHDTILVRIVHPVPVATHPPRLPARHAHDERVVGNILCNDAPGRDKSVAPDGDAANHCGVGSYGRTTPNQRRFVESLPVHLRARIGHIGQHAGGAEKNVILDDRSTIHGDIVLNLDVVANGHIGRNHHVLTQIAAIADDSTGHDVGEMPDASALADTCPLVNVAGLVNKVVFGFWLLVFGLGVMFHGTIAS